MSPKTDTPPVTFIDEGAIITALIAGARADAGRVREILAKAREANGLALDEVAALTTISDPELLGELFATARAIKEDIYGKRLVLFAPLYVSNLCENDCVYCAFRVRNKELKRRALTQDEIRHEIEILVDQGHKRVLLVAGESYPGEGFKYVLDSVATIYDVHRGNGEVRRVNVNVAPLSVEEFRELKATGIGTYQVFQETYHRETYRKVHLGGRKRDYDWRVTAMDRAMQGGIDDVGIGVLFGLFDWRFEILAILQHIHHLEETFGVGPHTISMPRIEPAVGSDLASQPPHPVDDLDFRKIVAITRLAVPYTGMIMSTRETGQSAPRDLRAGRLPDLGRQPHQPRRLHATTPSPTWSSSSSATTVRSTRSSATLPSWATSPRSAPPATASDAPAATSWTWPSRVRSSTTATPTPCRRSSSTSRTTARPRPGPPASSSSPLARRDGRPRAHDLEQADRAGARRRARLPGLERMPRDRPAAGRHATRPATTDQRRRRKEQRADERQPQDPRRAHHQPHEGRRLGAAGLHRVRLQHQDARRPPRRRRRRTARRVAWSSSS